MNDMQRLLTAAALAVLASVGCSSTSNHGNDVSSGGNGNGNPDGGADAPNPPAAGDVAISTAANDKQFETPFDATPDPDGKYVYFTAISIADGAPAIFKVGADGSGLTKLFAGDPLVSPFGITISDDGATLFIADAGAEDDSGELGAVFSMAASGGTPAAIAGTQGTLPKGIEARAGSVYYTGVSGAGAASVAAVYKMAAGGAPAIVASGLPLRDPSGVAVGKGGDVYVLDTSAASTHMASVFKVTGGAPTELARDIMVGYPSGIALSADETALVVSALEPTAATDVVFTLDLASGAQKPLGDAVQTTIGKFGDSAGLHRSRNASGGAAVFAWADGKANKTGTVYVLK